MKIRGGAVLAKALKHYGSDTVFSLPGHQILSVYDACIDEKIRLISTRHELSAVYMAEAMSYATRGMGAALLAGGPELTDALTGLAKAHYCNTPLLVVSGSNTLSKRDKGFPQDMDQFALVRPFTKWCRGCYDIRRIPEYICAAHRHSLNGRPGPVFVEIPYNIMEETVSEDQLFFPEKSSLHKACGDQGSIEEAAAAIRSAEKPLAVFGSGAFWSGAEEELAEFSRLAHVPLLAANIGLAMQLPPELIAGYGSPAISRFQLHAFAEADVIILLGTRVNFSMGFGQEPFISTRQKIIQIDVEPCEIGEHRKIDVGIAGDLKESLKALSSRFADGGPRDQWWQYLKQQKEKLHQELEPMLGSAAVPIHPLRLVRAVDRILEEDSILVLDGANSILWMLLGLESLAGPRIIVSPAGELEPIGAGIPHALAMKLAHPEKQVILHTGDGSFGFSAMEFETAVRCGVPFVAVVHNDGGYGMTRDMQLEFYGGKRELGNTLGFVRYDQVVQALGGHGEFVDNPDEIEPAVRRALDSNLPACVNVVVDPKPRSPGLMTYMLMEIMLGKETLYDKVPEIMRKLESWHLDEFAKSLMMRFLEGKLHRELS
jgi:acetolactate synthase-1/2/3 large subunit